MWDYYDLLGGQSSAAAVPAVILITEEADGNYLRFGSIGTVSAAVIGAWVAELLEGGGEEPARGNKSGDLDARKLSREEIAALLESANSYEMPPAAEVFEEIPSCSAPYRIGRVKDSALQAAAGVGGNLAAGNSLTWAVDGLMDDSDVGNVADLGHRCWQMNPAMSKAGFGYATSDVQVLGGGIYRQYIVEMAHDAGGQEPDYDFISWPASGNFPSTLPAFNRNSVWSVSLNPAKFQPPAWRWPASW